MAAKCNLSKIVIDRKHGFVSLHVVADMPFRSCGAMLENLGRRRCHWTTQQDHVVVLKIAYWKGKARRPLCEGQCRIVDCGPDKRPICRR